MKMKNKILDLIIELICATIVYCLPIMGAKKLGWLEDASILYTSIGFAVGWLIVKFNGLIQEKRKENNL